MFLRKKQPPRRHDNRAFWDERYATNPDLGSGLGSRGQTLEVKKGMIQRVVADIAPASILDIGCGDLELTRDLDIAAYCGVDISSEAIKIAAAKRPDWKFVSGDLCTLDLSPADLVLCFDVLIHQPTEQTYQEMVARLVRLSGKALLIGAYNQPPWYTSTITFYYEALSETLRRHKPKQLEIVGGYRDTTAILFVPGDK